MKLLCFSSKKLGTLELCNGGTLFCTLAIDISIFIFPLQKKPNEDLSYRTQPYVSSKKWLQKRHNVTTKINIAAMFLERFYTVIFVHCQSVGELNFAEF